MQYCFRNSLNILSITTFIDVTYLWVPLCAHYHTYSTAHVEFQFSMHLSGWPNWLHPSFSTVRTGNPVIKLSNYTCLTSSIIRISKAKPLPATFFFLSGAWWNFWNLYRSLSTNSIGVINVLYVVKNASWNRNSTKMINLEIKFSNTKYQRMVIFLISYFSTVNRFLPVLSGKLKKNNNKQIKKYSAIYFFKGQ